MSPALSYAATFFRSLTYISGLALVVGISVAVYLDSPKSHYVAQNDDSADVAAQTVDVSDSQPAVDARIEPVR